jgi:feruloyl esterase
MSVVWLFATSSGCGQNSEVHGNLRPACSALTRASIAGTAIFSANEVAAETPLGPFGPQPEHCVITGEIDRHEEPGGIFYGDTFELRLPLTWNGRFLFEAGGGFDGVLHAAVGGSPGTVESAALRRGYAVVTTDAGHAGTNEFDASFGVDPEARADYEYRSTDLVTRVAKQLVKQFYGRAPDHSYLVGCSNGGREGLVEAQRYPQDFDGIISGDPAFNLVRAAIAEAWNNEEFAKISPHDSTGMPLLYQSFSDADLSLVSKAVLHACDALDGLADGMIDNPAGCHFDPEVLVCKPSNNSDCLSSEKVHTLKTIFAGPKTSDGKALYSTWPYDAGIGAPGWRAWMIGTDKSPAVNVTLNPEFVNNIALAPGEAPLASPFAFNFGTDSERILKSEGTISTLGTLASFRSKGGKIIFYTGMSDPIFSANDLVEYYERVASANDGIEATKTFARLFLVPGMNHCGGGPALDKFDTLTALEGWVETGIAPDSMPATGVAFPGRSRPLCAYPLISHYKGKGSSEDAANFVCQTPRE